MRVNYRDHDRKVWESIFQKVPEDWLKAPPSEAMVRCVDFIKASGCRRILDVGCGFGRWAIFLGKSGVRGVLGVDYSMEGVKYASSWARGEHLQVSLICGDATRLPLQDAVFDGVIAAQVLDNLSRSDMDLALVEIERVTTSGAAGFFVFNPFLTSEQLEEYARSDNPTKDCMLEVYSDEELRQRLANWKILALAQYEHGLRVIEATKR